MSTKNSIVDKRIIKSKIALKESLLSLMQNKDFKAITITDIVQLADLNRGTFYKHYHYKEELLNEIIEDVVADLIISYREPYKQVKKFVIRELNSSAVKIFEHVEKHSSFYTLIVKSNVLYGFQNRICIELKRLALEDLSNIYTNTNNKIDNNLLASYTSYAILGMMIEWVKEGFQHSSSYMAEQLIEILNTAPVKITYRTNPISE
ncbi:TetR/AcrR family transcriptional regulator C-terminal domain-containing protein [Viridibacillus sp. FSL E2-0187]|uniref:TetR/AcrR family transcriptional regulator n=1 Tax=Viridibacillus TaxID=496496 RepID=UPI00187B3355|nr:TetR/AcrR family transcriptional regulator [Viridibacillus sp. JNUCC-6]QOV09663.1 TetR/AcrR family transcriptional regulator [Viridibacillus sp. JNUCC-6]